MILASSFCIATATMTDLLAEKYGERIVAYGLAGESLVQVYADPGDGSWSLVAVNPSGLSCIIAGGWAFEAVKAPPNL